MLNVKVKNKYERFLKGIFFNIQSFILIKLNIVFKEIKLIPFAYAMSML